MSQIQTTYDMVRTGNQSFLEAVQMVQSPALLHAHTVEEYADLGGYEVDMRDGGSYRDLLRQIDRAIGTLKRFRREVQAEAGHAHDWNEDDYCSICGRDGRA